LALKLPEGNHQDIISHRLLHQTAGTIPRATQTILHSVIYGTRCDFGSTAYITENSVLYYFEPKSQHVHYITEFGITLSISAGTIPRATYTAPSDRRLHTSGIDCSIRLGLLLHQTAGSIPRAAKIAPSYNRYHSSDYIDCSIRNQAPYFGLYTDCSIRQQAP
jgi:hypothetical protein